ncbi:unnamed protein product [Allacma fusca]|uniref:E3 SUMO-protein ligase NSE2 n=1 Tax=Allacma fusca TaxID=39272 RepID=A0A8J2P067_9HEXA|nr:unnamed protein product [Allacma fusca]
MPRQRAHAANDESEVQDQVTEAIQFGRGVITQLGKDILPHCDRRTQQEVTGRLSEAFKKLIRAELVYNECSVIVKEVAQGIEVENDDNQATILKACDKIETLSREGVENFKASVSDQQIVKDNLYVELMENLKEAVEESSGASAFDPQTDEEETDEDGSGNESEVDVDDEATVLITTIDPLTKKDLKSPVRNIHCNHIYEKKTILDFIKANPKAKCPIGGCINEKILKKDHLYSDDELVKMVTQKQRDQRRGRGKRR